VLYLIKRKESWYKLSNQEKNKITQETLAATLRAGGKRLTICDATWSSAGCEFFELTEFPDMSAVQKRIDFYEMAQIFRYYEISTVLGTVIPQVCHDDVQRSLSNQST
jgi:hypothetical protein